MPATKFNLWRFGFQQLFLSGLAVVLGALCVLGGFTILFLRAAAAEATERMPPEVPLGLDLYMAVPEDNPLTAEKVALGRHLFFDPTLSRNGRLSCASCHDPARGFTSGKAVSVGVFGRRGTRNVPTIINRAYGKAFFWDGRISSLEVQVLKPIQDPNEMDMTLETLVARLKRDDGYREAFSKVFGREISGDDLGKALASFVRTLLSGDSPYDRYVNGESEALSSAAREGLRLFRGKGNCTACHVGPNFSDERFHNTGVAWRNGRLLDQGRFAVTGRDEDQGAFKTPTLREVVHTAPYMHDGSLKTLREVVEFYNRGGSRNPHLDPELRPLNLTAAEQQALISFLKSLGSLRNSGRRAP